jgi:hypothetical protein
MSIIHDGGTDREMTEQEIVAAEATKAEAIALAKAEAKAQADKATAKQAVLDRLGITADEAALLLG